MEGQIQAFSRNLEGQESSGLDSYVEKSKTIWLYAHIPMYTVLSVKPTYVREKGIKSHMWQLLHVFRDDLGNIKGTKMVHGF